jgi:hypothetical protein
VISTESRGFALLGDPAVREELVEIFGWVRADGGEDVGSESIYVVRMLKAARSCPHGIVRRRPLPLQVHHDRQIEECSDAYEEVKNTTTTASTVGRSSGWTFSPSLDAVQLVVRLAGVGLECANNRTRLVDTILSPTGDHFGPERPLACGDRVSTMAITQYLNGRDFELIRQPTTTLGGIEIFFLTRRPTNFLSS